MSSSSSGDEVETSEGTGQEEEQQQAGTSTAAGSRATEMEAYERARMERVARNKAMLQTLAVPAAAASLFAAADAAGLVETAPKADVAKGSKAAARRTPKPAGFPPAPTRTRSARKSAADAQLKLKQQSQALSTVDDDDDDDDDSDVEMVEAEDGGKSNGKHVSKSLRRPTIDVKGSRNKRKRQRTANDDDNDDSVIAVSDSDVSYEVSDTFDEEEEEGEEEHGEGEEGPVEQVEEAGRRRSGRSNAVARLQAGLAKGMQGSLPGKKQGTETSGRAGARKCGTMAEATGQGNGDWDEEQMQQALAESMKGSQGGGTGVSAQQGDGEAGPSSVATGAPVDASGKGKGKGKGKAAAALAAGGVTRGKARGGRQSDRLNATESDVLRLFEQLCSDSKGVITHKSLTRAMSRIGMDCEEEKVQEMITWAAEEAKTSAGGGASSSSSKAALGFEAFQQLVAMLSS